MDRLPALRQWTKVVDKRFPHLSKPMVACLALWSLGIIVARSCSLTAIAWTLASMLGQKFDALRERLRDFYRGAPAKSGTQRAELDLNTCWAPWLSWVLDGWHGKQVALALDATTLGQKFTVLAISVLYRGCAVPVAWKILPATEAHAWEPEWKALLRPFRERVPADWKVIVLADRGLYAKWLFEAIVDLGWHPLLRINSQGKYRPADWRRWRSLETVVQRTGGRWQGRATVFKTPESQVEGTLLACWDEGYADPWLVLTDLGPEAADVCWYGLRAWIEQGFKRMKRGGWQWQYTRMVDPSRAERMWLAMSVATWWLMSVGGEADEGVLQESMPAVPQTQRRRHPQWRLIAIFHRGWVEIMAALIGHTRLPLGAGRPEPWPNMLPAETVPKNLHL